MKTLLQLQKEYGEAVDGLDSLVAEGGDAYDAAVKNVEALLAQINRVKAHEQRKAAMATEFKAIAITPPAAEVKLAPGQNVARLMLSLAASKGDVRQASDFAQKHWGSSADPLVKNLLASVGTAGGFLVPDDIRAELIELLRPRSVVFASGPRVIEMPRGNVTIPGLATGVSANYVGEAQPITASTQTYRQVTMVAKKLASLVPISNDFIRYPTASTDMFVRDDMLAAIATKTDQTLLRGLGTEFAPKGLWAWAQDVAATNVITANTTINLVNVTNDLGKVELALLNANVPMTKPGWIISPRTMIFLMNLRDGNGNIAFPEVANGMLRGKPYKATTSVPDNIGGTTVGSEIYLVEFNEFLVGESISLELAMADGAAFFDGTNTVSAFSQDQVVMRAITAHDSAMRQAKAVAMLDDVRWIP